MSRQTKGLIAAIIATVIACTVMVGAAISKTVADDEKNLQGFYGFDMSSATGITVKAVSSEGSVTESSLDSGKTFYEGSNQLSVGVSNSDESGQYTVLLTTEKTIPDSADKIIYIDQQGGNGGTLDFTVYPTTPDKTEELRLYVTSDLASFETKYVDFGYMIKEKEESSESTSEEPATEPATKATEPTTKAEEPTTKVEEPTTKAEEPTTQPSGSSEGRFTDVNHLTVVNTSYNAIYWAADNGIVSGYKDGTFKPEVICTREQFSIMLWRFAGEPDANADSVDKFNDSDDFAKGARKAVSWALEQGIVAGFDDGSFKPKDDITRAQVAIMLWRFAGKPAVSGESKFSDIGGFSANVQKAIIWLEGNKIASGYKDGTFQPNGGCQRQHMAIFLYRYAKNILDWDVD